MMSSQHPDPAAADFLWCPVMGDWCKGAVAGHLFPSMFGDDLMKVIFGDVEQDMWIGNPEKGRSELFRACNGILWSKQAEERFSSGHFTIVPDLDEDPTPAQSEAWQRSNPKEYRIRVLHPDAAEMKRLINLGSDVRWADLDNKRLQWRANFRPRARYLYWSYCETMLRQAYSSASNTDVTELRRQEVGKRYWGSAGSYMKKNMLMGFVEEMGHDYEHLMEGAMEADDEDDGDEEKGESSEVAVTLANESILEKQAMAERKNSGADMDSEYSGDKEDSSDEEDSDMSE